MSTSATDVITYVGVPLAVLGVLPILWTAIKTLILSFRIRNELSQNLSGIDLSGIDLRSSVFTNTDILSGQVNVKYQHTRLWPLQAQHKQYSQLRPLTSRSRLRGGSWTILNWSITQADELDEAVKKYVLTPGDRLRQPAARVDFPALVRFLMDIGAVVYPAGLEKLKAEEQRVVSGTDLLRALNGAPVLVTTGRDDDEDNEILSLKLSWEGVGALSDDIPNDKIRAPLNWIRIGPCPKAHKTARTKFIPPQNRGKTYTLRRVGFATANATEIGDTDGEPPKEDQKLRTPNGRTWPASHFKGYENSDEMIENFQYDPTADEAGWRDILGEPGSDTDDEKWKDPLRHAQSKKMRRGQLERLKTQFSSPEDWFEKNDVVDPILFSVHPDASQSEDVIGVLLTRGGIQEARSLGEVHEKATQIDFQHLLPQSDSEKPPTTDSEDHPGTWFNSIAKALATKEQVLCSYHIPERLFSFAHAAHKLKPTIPCGVLLHVKLIKQSDCLKWQPEDYWTIFIAESNAARQASLMNFHRPGPGPAKPAFPTSSHGEPQQHEVRQRVENNRVPHALASPLWPVGKIAALMLPWLQEEFAFERAPTAAEMAEWTLRRMLLYPAEAAEVAGMLNKWHSWSEHNAIEAADVKTMSGHKTTFALAACVLDVLGEYANTGGSQVADVLEQCLARWGDVLLN
ncbi:hypothetical protein MMC34_000569 [Xylographa carneopallida]|nr:hypothetical protein [Xylographa carneopallida]